MKQVIEAGRNYSPQEMQEQETYYWVVTLYAGDPSNNGIVIGSYRQLVTKKEERATDLAEQWLNEGRILPDGRELFVEVEQMVVKSSVVYVK